MSSRVLFLLCASLAATAPEAAWAGSGGPTTYTIVGMLVIIIIMLALIWKKIN